MKVAACMALWLLLAFMPSAVSTLGSRTVEHRRSSDIRISPDLNAPAVVVENSERTLLIPKDLMAVIREEFPEMRIPVREDVRGYWREVQGELPFPYITWGDYTLNGLTDVTIILLGESEWNLVTFHQSSNRKYEAHCHTGSSARQIGRKNP